MARLFNLALEEVAEEIDAAPVAEPLDDVEAIENSESAAADEAEINQGTDEVTEALEEADALQEQVDVNEKVLENTSDEVVEDAAASSVDNDVSGEVVVPESAVTESQVVEAQEALKYAIASFGNKVGYVNVVRVSTENAKRLSRREQLRIANEDAKDFIAKLIETAKRIIKQLAAKVVVWVKKMFLKLGNYQAAIKGFKDSLPKVKAEEIDAKGLSDSLRKIGAAEVNYVLLGKSIEDQIGFATKGVGYLRSTLGAIATAGNVVEANKLPEVKLEDYGFKALSEGKAVNVTGSQALVVGEKGYKTVKLEVADTLANATANVKNVIDNLIKSNPSFDKFASEVSSNIKLLQNIQSDVSKKLDALKPKDGEDKNVIAKNVESAKSIGITAVMFLINKNINVVKNYVAIAKVVSKTKKGGEEKPAEDKKEEAKA